jgi:hypothetical protein
MIGILPIHKNERAVLFEITWRIGRYSSADLLQAFGLQNRLPEFSPPLSTVA